jgi:hypothetical protein
MRFSSTYLAATSIVSTAFAAPLDLTTLNSETSYIPSLIGDRYIQYSGDGSAWPGMDQWYSKFEDMLVPSLGSTGNNSTNSSIHRWNANVDLMRHSCGQWRVADNSEQEIADIRQGIAEAGFITGVDLRFILAIVMQESGGCVRAPTTSLEVRNPGIMQDHNGRGTCNEAGRVSNPCPGSTIKQMILEGTGGTLSLPSGGGDGLKQTLEQARADGARKYYRAARIYNSGSVHGSGNLEAGIATHCYASDVANRLTGWTRAPTECRFPNRR